MRIYVGNLSYEVTEEELRQEFGAFGEVASVEIITDRDSGRTEADRREVSFISQLGIENPLLTAKVDSRPSI